MACASFTFPKASFPAAVSFNVVVSMMTNFFFFEGGGGFFFLNRMEKWTQEDG